MKVKQQTMFETNIEMLKQVQHDKQEGRSMVEMLGVLAIIGVLSVAGIAGYSMAMKRYRANEVVNTASVLYTLAEANYLTSGETSHSLASAELSKPSGISDMRYDIDTKNITIEGADDLCGTIISIAGGAEYHITNVTCS